MNPDLYPIFYILVFGIIIYILFNRHKKARETEKNPNDSFENAISKAKSKSDQSIRVFDLTKKTWLLRSNMPSQVLYTFKENNQLFITTDGIVEKCSYEYLTNQNNLLIHKSGITEFYKVLKVRNELLELYKIFTKETLSFETI